jgi:hypothetical protein
MEKVIKLANSLSIKTLAACTGYFNVLNFPEYFSCQDRKMYIEAYVHSVIYNGLNGLNNQINSLRQQQGYPDLNILLSINYFFGTYYYCSFTRESLKANIENAFEKAFSRIEEDFIAYLGETLKIDYSSREIFLKKFADLVALEGITIRLLGFNNTFLLHHCMDLSIPLVNQPSIRNTRFYIRSLHCTESNANLIQK